MKKAGVTANKETVNCSLGFVLAFPRLLKRTDSGVAVTNLPLKQMPISSVSRVGFFKAFILAEMFEELKIGSKVT